MKMNLIKTKLASGDVRWVLTVKGIQSCRHCKGLIKFGENGYYCQGDKKISCLDCRDKDNLFDHSRRYFTKNNPQHTHYFVELIRSKLKEE